MRFSSAQKQNVSWWWRSLVSMKSSRCLWALFTVATFLTAALPADPASSASIGVNRQNEEAALMLLMGPIEKGDARRLREQIERMNEKDKYVYAIKLYSPGGLVSEGIEIGRILREYRITTLAPADYDGFFACDYVSENGENYYFSSNQSDNCICASACALAWFGGVNRGGVAGVHRSFLPTGDKPLSSDEQEQILDKSISDIRSYLSEMRVPLSVVEELLATSSKGLTFFDAYDDEAIKKDPLWAEYIISHCGEGLSREEKLLSAELLLKEHNNEALAVSERAAKKYLNERYNKFLSCETSAKKKAMIEAQLD